MSLPLSNFSNELPKHISIETYYLTLARFSELSTSSLEKLLEIFMQGAKECVETRALANSVVIYALATTLFALTVIYFTPKQKKARKVVILLSLAAALTAALATFTSLVYSWQIKDYRYWQSVCITFIGQNKKIS